MTTKLIIQISCLNEAETLPITLSHLPKAIPGIDIIETLIVDDGSTDNTSEIARLHGVTHIIRHNGNKGLPKAVNTGMLEAIRLGADILVNTDADNQYRASDIEKLVKPILDRRADLVYGQRPIMKTAHFSSAKKFFQLFGAKIVSMCSGLDLIDAASGFRAMNKETVCRLFLVCDFASPLQVLIQARNEKCTINCVHIGTNPDIRPSRLIKSTVRYIFKSSVVIVENYALYNPLKTFGCSGVIILTLSFWLYIWRSLLLTNGSPTSMLQATIHISFLMSLIFGLQLFAIAFILTMFRHQQSISKEHLYRQNLQMWGKN